jgi:hypothetical protein
MGVGFAVCFVGGGWCDGTPVPDTTDMSVAEAGQLYSTVLCEENCFKADIAVGGSVFV